jgi:hypothetical protein
LELLEIIYSLRVWRYYLIGTKFELNTYHYGLQHIFMQSELNVRHRCCSELLSEYEFEITYIKGKVNRVVDGSSQRPCIFSLIPLKKNL